MHEDKEDRNRKADKEKTESGNMQSYYVAIDLKSFFASVECVDRNLDPLKTNLVVADVSRTEKTICLAVSPSLKAYGLPGRARLFEVVQRVKEINAKRLETAPEGKFTGSSVDAEELKLHPEYALDYVAAVPRMSHYIKYSNEVYKIYLRYIAPEDIHVYSIDEVFMDVTQYLSIYHRNPEELARKMIQDILDETGITATAGVGTNLYLCKVAMDIVAKRMPADAYGVRIASLDEITYRKLLWTHEPLTDFWRVGRGISRRLKEVGIHTMGDVARCSLGKDTDYYNEDLLYKIFGINAELLIDHAWGYEPCTIADIKGYKPQNNCLSSGQVLSCPYTYEQAKTVLKEMTEHFVLDLVDKGVAADQMVLDIGYDLENLTRPEIRKKYKGEITMDHYGRKVPKHAHGTVNLGHYSSSTKEIMKAVMGLYASVVNPDLLIRRINLTGNHVISEPDAIQKEEESYEQLDLFTDYEMLQEEKAKEKEQLEKEKRMQHAIIDIKKKYGGNAILKGTDFMDGATARERNRQIGGHKA